MDFQHILHLKKGGSFNTYKLGFLDAEKPEEPKDKKKEDEKDEKERLPKH